MIEQITVKNVKLMWCHLAEPYYNPSFQDADAAAYQASVILSEADRELVKSKICTQQQIKPDKKTGELTINLKSKTRPVVLGEDGTPMSDEDRKAIGNGTIANMHITFYSARGKTFAGLGAIRIKKLNKYVAGGDTSDLEDEDTMSNLAELEDD